MQSPCPRRVVAHWARHLVADPLLQRLRTKPRSASGTFPWGVRLKTIRHGSPYTDFSALKAQNGRQTGWQTAHRRCPFNRRRHLTPVSDRQKQQF